MSIYIQVENIHDGHSKRFGPYKAVSPGNLQVDEGNGWTGGPVQPVWSDITDDTGEPYSWIENVRVEGEDPTYWHNCYIVSDPTPTEKFADSVFAPYTDEPTMLRIHREHNGDWTLDGINEHGLYTETTWSYDDLDDLLVNLPAFIEQHATHLKDDVTYTTKYMPIVTATHDEDGNVISVEVDFGDAQSAIEQTQEDGTTLDETDAENLGMHFDKWAKEQPQAVRIGHWRWEVDDD